MGIENATALQKIRPDMSINLFFENRKKANPTIP